MNNNHNHKPNLQIIKAKAEDFCGIINDLVEQNYRLAHLFGTDDRSTFKTFGVHAILTPQGKDEWVKVDLDLSEKNPKYESLTKTLISANWYEKYLMDMFGIKIEGHPDKRRLVHHQNIPLNTHPLRKDFAWNTILKKENHPHPMNHVEGNGVFEIPVGPIHAGIIEPGHFRFNVAGERIITLEGKLFFTHKGTEKIIEGKSIMDALPFIERISTDSATSHALTYAQTIEEICNAKIPEKASLLRTMISELERITMHIHDLANIAGMGTGYTVMAAHGFRIKEKLVRLSEKLFNNRFWRGFIVPGGVSRNLDKTDLELIWKTVGDCVQEMEDLLEMGLNSDGLCERMVNSGILKTEAAKAYGAVGIAARGSGLKVDTRIDHPYASYKKLKFEIAVKNGMDVFARYQVRIAEIRSSFSMMKELCELLKNEKDTKIKVNLTPQKGEGFSAVESWRGEIIHFVRLNEKGQIDRISIRDPSFCNWPLFGEIGPGNIVPDFPLCNKSLNLSYSGTDL